VVGLELSLGGGLFRWGIAEGKEVLAVRSNRGGCLGRKKIKEVSLAGSRTPLSRVTGGCTSRYTTRDLGEDSEITLKSPTTVTETFSPEPQHKHRISGRQVVFIRFQLIMQEKFVFVFLPPVYSFWEWEDLTS
jgi:hypothetical protein